MARAGFIEVEHRSGSSSKYTLIVERAESLFPSTPAKMTPLTPSVRTGTDIAMSPITVSRTVNKKILLAQFPEWLPVSEWNCYLEMRKRLKHPLVTNSAIGMAIGKLDDLRNAGHDPKLVLEQSIFNSWKGLFELQPKFLSRSEPSRDAAKFDPSREVKIDHAEMERIKQKYPDLA
jgi:hypothetical protein